MIGKDPTELSAIELASAVSQGALSTRVVAEAFIARLEAVNPQINAIVYWNRDSIIDQMSAVSDRLQRGERLPLAGVPVAVKDNLWVEGWPVTQGSRLFERFIPSHDAFAVAQLRQAGAVILGIANCPEFACRGVTTNKVYGPTKNPWNLGRTPGGSSGGSASAVSARLCPIALGTDAGGSIRRPAAHTGTVGFMPSCGAVPSTRGFVDPAFGNNTIGIIARDVNDIDQVMNLMTVNHPGTAPVPSLGFGALCSRPPESVSELRIGYSADLGLDTLVDPDVERAVSSAVKALLRYGAKVQDASPAWPENMSERRIEALERVALAAIYGDRYELYPELFDPDVGSQIQEGMGLSGVDVAHALFFREALQRHFSQCFQEIDVLLCPATPVTAWPLGQAWPGEIAGQAAGPRDHAAFTWLINQVFAPACSVPCGLGADGLPIGIQVIAPRLRDKDVLEVAQDLQRALGQTFVLSPSI